jgi:UDP-2-acetamido-2-deoxy-ribo-hexuluronate aminotransferase
LFTDNDDLASRMKAIRTHGGIKRHQHAFLGTNGRFDTLQAAVLLAKLPHFDWELRERNRIAARYSTLLSSHCSVPMTAHGNTHVYAQYTVRIHDRDKVTEELKRLGIPSAVYYPKCLHEQPIFATLGYQKGDFPESEKAAQEVLSLPMHPFLSEADQDRIVDALVNGCSQGANRSTPVELSLS